MSDDILMDCEVDRLKQHPQNARKGDVNAIAQSLERFGQVKPLIVQKSTGFIVAGNHTYQAAVKLKWPKVKILVKDLSDEDALAYLLADNRTSDKGSYDNEALYDLLGTVVNLEGTGFDADEMETLADALGGNVSDVDDIGDAVTVAPDERVTRPATEAAKARGGEPMRDIVMLMRASEATEFGAEVAQLQKRWGTRTVVETVRRAVSTCLSIPDELGEPL